MGYIVQDRIEVSLFLNGTEYPLDSINSFNFIQMDMALGTLLPTCHISLNDSADLITANKLIADATKVSVVIKGFGTTQSSIYNFRVFHYKPEKVTMGTRWEFDGYWDAQTYWLTTTSTAVRGTSDTVLSRIAATCELGYDGVSTADTQLWVPQNRVYGEFVRFIARRGYINDRSFMMFGVDLNGVLRYKDMNDLGPPKFQLVYGEYQQDETPVVDYRPVAKSGFNNKLTGYYNNRRRQTAQGSSDQEDIRELQFTSDSREPLFNDETRRVQQRGYQIFSPIDFGNVHDAYERAFYQNMRYGNLHNIQVSFLTHVKTNLNIFDVFNFSTRKAGGELDSQNSGSYKMTAKTILVQGMNYYELIKGARHGTNLQEKR